MVGFSSSRAETLTIGGTGAALGSLQLLANAYRAINPDRSIIIHSSFGSGGGIKAVIKGAIHIGLSARPLNVREKQSGIRASLYAQTPFILVTSRIEEKINLTTAELASIYSGEQITWQDGSRIRLVLRPVYDADWRLLAGISPELNRSLADASTRRGLPIGFTDQESMSMIEKLPGGLGTATLTAIISENRALRAITLDGVDPSVENLANGSYPLKKSLYLVTRTSPKEITRHFIAFLRSEEGARILTETGNLVIPAADSD